MTRWVLQEWVPYAGISEDVFECAEHLADYIRPMTKTQRADLSIFPEPIKTYEPFEFLEAFDRGELT